MRNRGCKWVQYLCNTNRWTRESKECHGVSPRQDLNANNYRNCAFSDSISRFNASFSCLSAAFSCANSCNWAWGSWWVCELDEERLIVAAVWASPRGISKEALEDIEDDRRLRLLDCALNALSYSWSWLIWRVSFTTILPCSFSIKSNTCSLDISGSCGTEEISWVE